MRWLGTEASAIPIIAFTTWLAAATASRKLLFLLSPGTIPLPLA
ncbi:MULTISPECIES: hypothetical protein [unclassified Mesorhizobium]|nr:MULTISPECIES: hypothetical protein [unclassified Mesorhizobium]